MNLTKTLRRGLTIATLMVAFLFLAAACGGESTPTATPPTAIPTPTLSDVLTNAGEKMAAMSSAKFDMVDEKESGAKFFDTTFKSLEAEVKAPDSFRMLVDVVSPAFGFIEIEMMAVGEQAFIKFSKDAPWAPLPLDGVPFNFSGLGMTFSEVIHMIRDGDGAITGSESVLGGQTIRVEGTVQSEQLTNLITDVDSGHTITLTLWIDEAEHFLRQLRLAGQLYDDDGPETTRLVTINAIDVPVEIELPDLEGIRSVNDVSPCSQRLKCSSRADRPSLTISGASASAQIRHHLPVGILDRPGPDRHLLTGIITTRPPFSVVVHAALPSIGDGGLSPSGDETPCPLPTWIGPRGYLDHNRAFWSAIP